MFRAKALISFSMLFLIIALVGVPSASAKGPFLTVRTDAASYTGAQTVIVSGQVIDPPGPGTAVFLKILFPSGGPAAVASAPVNGTNGFYQQKFILGGSSSWIAGTYTVNATWGTSATTLVTNKTTFTYTPATTSTTSTTTTSTSSTTTSSSTTTTSSSTTRTTSSTTTTTTTTTTNPTSSTTTSSTTSTSPTTTSSTTSTTSSSSSAASTSTSGGGGIPEFPYQLLATTAFAALLVASYLLTRDAKRIG